MTCRDIIKAKSTVNDPETGDSHATTSQGMHFFRVFVPVCVSHHCCVTADCYCSITFFSA